jgi:hypothetical protein
MQYIVDRFRTFTTHPRITRSDIHARTLNRRNAIPERGPRSSYGFAAQFAGPDGHVATLHEIITARAGQPLEHPIWSHYYTTASCEYFGRSAGGVPIVIVTHGSGPINDSWTAEAAYLPIKFRDDGRPLGESGHIPLSTFRKLERGDFGPVSVIEFKKVARAYPDGWSTYLRLRQLERDPLLQARLGPDWHCISEKLHRQTLEEGLDGSNHPPTVHSDIPYDYWHAKDEPPLGHLLLASQTFTMSAEGENFIGMSVSLHERTNNSRCIGLRANGSLAGVHQGPELLQHKAHLLMLPNSDAPLATFFPLMEIDGAWYSCVRKEGRGLDTGWPEFKVTAIEHIGRTGKITVEDARFFFRYDMAEVMWAAPEGANAYYLGEVKPIAGSADAQEAVVHFCRVTLDTTQRCVTKAELEGSFDQQMSLLARTM